MGGKRGEVRFFPGFDPDRAGETAGPLVFLNKVGGDTGSAVVVVPPAGEAGGFGAVGRGGGNLAGREPVADLRGGGETVGEAGDLGGLFRSETVGFGWEQSFLVPSQEAPGGAKKGEFPASGAEILVGLRKGEHRLMMRQENIPWNVGMLLLGSGYRRPRRL